MENRDQTAQPSKVSVDRQNDRFIPWQFENDSFVSPGLTKREYAAIAAMQGLVSNMPLMEALINSEECTGEAVSRMAVGHADALFDELELQDGQK